MKYRYYQDGGANWRGWEKAQTLPMLKNNHSFAIPETTRVSTKFPQPSYTWFDPEYQSMVERIRKEYPNYSRDDVAAMAEIKYKGLYPERMSHNTLESPTRRYGRGPDVNAIFINKQDGGAGRPPGWPYYNSNIRQQGDAVNFGNPGPQNPVADMQRGTNVPHIPGSANAAPMWPQEYGQDIFDARRKMMLSNYVQSAYNQAGQGLEALNNVNLKQPNSWRDDLSGLNRYEYNVRSLTPPYHAVKNNYRSLYDNDVASRKAFERDSLSTDQKARAYYGEIMNPDGSFKSRVPTTASKPAPGAPVGALKQDGYLAQNGSFGTFRPQDDVSDSPFRPNTVPDLLVEYGGQSPAFSGIDRYIPFSGTEGYPNPMTQLSQPHTVDRLNAGMMYDHQMAVGSSYLPYLRTVAHEVNPHQERLMMEVAQKLGHIASSKPVERMGEWGPNPGDWGEIMMRRARQSDYMHKLNSTKEARRAVYKRNEDIKSATPAPINTPSNIPNSVTQTSTSSDKSTSTPTTTPATPKPAYKHYGDIPKMVSLGTYSDAKFSDAFKKARKDLGSNQVFEWKGKK
jgi:hypothetical protein